MAAQLMRVVAIGGGTGLSTLLRGLCTHVVAPGQLAPEPGQIGDLAAVVTVTDDGGSSGRLRKDFNMLPPGDLRNCMVALAEEGDLLARLFAHRFRAGSRGRRVRCADARSRDPRDGPERHDRACRNVGEA